MIPSAAGPGRVLRLWHDLGKLESTARATYLRLAWHRRRARLRTHIIPSAPNITLITICHANVLRSAYAEALLKQPAVVAFLPGLRVSSAGLHAIPRSSPSTLAVRVARENGLDLSTHRATLLNAQLVSAADLLVVMDYLNEAEVVSRHPDAEGKVVLLGNFDPIYAGDIAIPDPHAGDLQAVRATYRRVAAAVAGLLVELSHG